jgi:hypothetical protein
MSYLPRMIFEATEKVPRPPPNQSANPEREGPFRADAAAGHLWIGNLNAVLMAEGPCFPSRSPRAPMVPTSSEPSLSAYRSAADPRSAAKGDPEDAFRERLHPVFVIVWAASLARAAGALYGHEVFGAEATLALMTVVAVTWYAAAVRVRARRPRD